MNKNIKAYQAGLLNYLLLATEDQLHYCTSIKLAFENRLKAMQEFIVDDNPSDKKIIQALARFAIPLIQYQIHIENYSFTIENNPKIIQHIYKYIQAFTSMFNFIGFYNNKMLELNSFISQGSVIDKNLRIDKLKNEMQIQIEYNFYKNIFSVNMCIYSLVQIIQEIETYLKFLNKSKTNLLFYTGNYVAYIDSIAQEITRYLGNDDSWLWAFYKPTTHKANYISKAIHFAKSLWIHKHSKQYCLVSKESNYELVNYEQLQKLQAESIIKKATVNLEDSQTDLLKKGFFVKTNNDKMKIVFRNEMVYNLFRGQHEEYNKQLFPSFQRLNIYSIEHCIEFIKREEFKELFKTTPYYKILRQLNVLGSYFEFDLDAIAQHYGFATNYLDITQDEKVALFFAYTYFVDDKYFPIDDFIKYQPILYKARFGFYPNKQNPLIPIGFQAVLRPQNQMAMAITSNNIQDNLIKYFECKQLETNANIAHKIYDEFEGGEKLFPKNEPIHIVESELKERKILSEHLFLEYCKKFNKDENKIATQLIQKDYAISKPIQPNYEKLFAKMEIDIHQKIIPWIKENVLYYRKLRAFDDFPNNLFPQSLK